MRNRKQVPLLGAVIALGFAGQVGQILLLRELLMVFHGSELSIGVILAAWMVWVGVGSRWASHYVPRARRPLRLLVCWVAGLFLAMPASLVASRLIRGFFPVLPGALLSLSDMVIACFLLLAPVGLLLGGAFVLLARLWREADGETNTLAAGKAYMAEAVGSIVGGVFFTFVLVRMANVFPAALLAVGMLAIAVLWYCRRQAGTTGSSTVTRGAILLALAGFAALPLFAPLDAWSYGRYWRHLAPEHAPVARQASRYGLISIALRDGQYSFFQSGHFLFSTAGPDAPAALEEQEAATFAHFAMTQHRNPQRVLLLGGGLRGTLREILRHHVAHIDYVEIDPALPRAARPFLPPDTLDALADPRVRLHHIDGRRFLKSATSTYDIILVDVPDPATAVLNRFYTEEFFREAADRLEPDGVLVLGAVSTPDLRGTAVANRNATIFHTLQRVFPEVLPVGDRFLFFFACREPGQITDQPLILRERFLDRGVEAPAFSPGQFAQLLLPSPLRRVNWVLRNHGRRPRAHLQPPEFGPMLAPPLEAQIEAAREAPPVWERGFINSDFRPVAYFHTLAFWNALTRTDASPAFEVIARVEAWWMLLPIAFCLVMVAVLRLLRRRTDKPHDLRFAVRLAVFTTGFSTMSLQMALLFLFQSLYGYVYEQVGLIVAIFMAGLLLGAATTQRSVADKSNVHVLMLVQMTIAIFAALISLGLPAVAGVRWPPGLFLLFAGLTFSAGLLNGLDFPLAAACCLRLDGQAEKATGTVYGIELFGACSGALLASVVVAPMLGIGACAWLASAANGLAFGVLTIARRKYEPTGGTAH